MRKTRLFEDWSRDNGNWRWIPAVMAVLVVSTVAMAWSPVDTHSTLANKLLSDAAISPFITEFGVDKNSVVNWYSEPPSEWHHPGWTMIDARGYLGTYNGMDWTSLDETTRLRYLTHIVSDCGVPVGHSPAGYVYVSSTAESQCEAQAATWSDFPSIGTYSGTIHTVHSSFYNNQIAIATWFKNTPTFLGFHDVDDVRHASWYGMSYSLNLGKAMLADYFLAKRNTVAEAGSNYIATPGGSVTFNSAGSSDPDSITWSSTGTYANNGGGIASVAWELDNDSSFDEASGSTANVSHSQLASWLGYSETGATIQVRVTDDEGKAGYDSATVKIFSNPVADAGADYTVNQNQDVQLSGSGYDPDGGSITSYAWDIDNDGQYDDAYGATPQLTYSQLLGYGFTAGNSYTIGMQVVDNDGAYAGNAVDTALLTMSYGSGNIAPNAVASADSVQGSWYASGVNDGEFDHAEDDCWRSASGEPHWIQLTWSEDVDFDSVTLYCVGYVDSKQDPKLTLQDFDIQIWDGNQWVTVDSVTDNSDVVYEFLAGTTLTTDMLRVWITDAAVQGSAARLLEIEVELTGAGGQQIPEPATLGLLLIGALPTLRRKRK